MNGAPFPPQPFRWSGEAMIPLRPRTADKLFVIGQEYVLEEHELHSSPRRRAFFATINDIWKTLPDDLADRFPKPDALRKEALKATGWCDTTTEVCASNAEARRWAERLRKYLPSDAYPTISIAGCAVVVIVAKSQAERAMSMADFRLSADAVLHFLAEKIGISPSDLSTERAA